MIEIDTKIGKFIIERIEGDPSKCMVTTPEGDKVKFYGDVSEAVDTIEMRFD